MQRLQSILYMKEGNNCYLKIFMYAIIALGHSAQKPMEWKKKNPLFSFIFVKQSDRSERNSARKVTKSFSLCGEKICVKGLQR